MRPRQLAPLVALLGSLSLLAVLWCLAPREGWAQSNASEEKTLLDATMTVGSATVLGEAYVGCRNTDDLENLVQSSNPLKPCSQAMSGHTFTVDGSKHSILQLFFAPMNPSPNRGLYAELSPAPSSMTDAEKLRAFRWWVHMRINNGTVYDFSQETRTQKFAWGSSSDAWSGGDTGATVKIFLRKQYMTGLNAQHATVVAVKKFHDRVLSYEATIPYETDHIELQPLTDDNAVGLSVESSTSKSWGERLGCEESDCISAPRFRRINTPVGTHTFHVYARKGQSVETYPVTITRLPPPPVPLSLSASPNPVQEGAEVTVTVRLDSALGTDVTVPLLVTPGTAETNDYGTLDPIVIIAGALNGTGTITTAQDADTSDETFTVAVDTATLPGSVRAGSPSSVEVTITDDDTGTRTGGGNTDGGNTGGGNTGGGNTGGGSSGGGGGGGRTRSQPDQHGDSISRATNINPRRYTTGPIRRRLDARLQTRNDRDYFELELPHAGVLTAETQAGNTVGRLYTDREGEIILVAEDDRQRGPFYIGAPVEPGLYYIAVSAGSSFGDYRLRVDYTPAFVDNPAPNSPQSGLSVLSGWVCEAATVEIEVETPGRAVQTLEPATGTARADTAAVCGAATTETGFGLLFNWNLLGDGPHTVRVVIDDVVFTERQITVTTLGPHPEQEFRRGLTAMTTLPDFPAVGETTTLRWAEALQNFVIASGDRGSEGEQVTPEQARLENPAPGSFQSGLGVISGWVCAADTVEIVFEPEATDDTLPFEAGSGTERADTADQCGDTDNGFGLLFNWNLLGEGQHTVRAYADGEEFAHSTVTVTTLAGEFARGLRRRHQILDFPEAGQTTTVEWQESQQNFVVTAVE